MTIRWRMAMLASACLGVTACQQEQAPIAVEDEDQTEAEGQVLQGTISDAMIPYPELGRDTAMALPPPVAQIPDATPAAAGATARPAASPQPASTTAASTPRAAPSPAADPEEPAAGEE